MANTFRKVYKKTGNSGNDADYELIANVGVNGVDLDIMKGASSSTDGELGLVPKPTKDKYKFFLRASGIWDCIYPIGSIYFSVNNVNPSEYFGGTWISWGSGRVPVGVNSSDSSFNTVEKTGGESRHTLTVSEMPRHNHNFDIFWEGGGTTTGGANYMDGGVYGSRMTSMAGSGQPHNNLQPYITCYMWKRTA